MENQNLYSEYFSSQSSWNEQEALEWIKIFADADDDDYSALAWDIVLFIERQISAEGISELDAIRSYWAQIALHGLRPQLHSVESD